LGKTLNQTARKRTSSSAATKEKKKRKDTGSMFHFIAAQSTTTKTTIAQTTAKLWYKRNQSKANQFVQKGGGCGVLVLVPFPRQVGRTVDTGRKKGVQGGVS
jgi:hypothetical protein